MGRLDPQFSAPLAPVHGRGAGRARQGEGEAEAGALGLAANCPPVDTATFGRYATVMAAPFTVIDAVTIAFACATVILTGVAIGLAVVAWFAYRDIKASMLKIAESTARDVAADVAARQLGAYIGRHEDESDGAVEAYRELDP